MGKEWLYWVGGRSGGGGGGGGGGTGGSSAKRERMPRQMKEAATSSGCMCAVFHLFDLHNFQFPSYQQNRSDFHPNKYPFLHEEATTSKGVEAPRNSLELEAPAAMNAASMSLAIKKEEKDLNFPVGIQIKTNQYSKISSPRISTSVSKSRLDDFSSECSSNSPGAKTPSVVARLMGLDLLPECNSPSISSSRPKPHKKTRLQQRKDRDLLHKRSFFDDDIGVGARSLPETPRISSARRSDVEHHRLSLQMNKETYINEEFSLSDKIFAGRGRLRLRPQDENTSPGHSARQIVKQVRDSVSRRVGIDITNTINRNRENRRDGNLVLLKPTKKNSKISSRFVGEISPDGKQPIRLKFLDPNKKKSTATNSLTRNPSDHQMQGIRNPSKPRPQEIVPLQEKEQLQQQNGSKKIDGGSGKCSSSRFKKLRPQASDRAIRNKKEEQFVHSKATNKLNVTDYKSRRTPLSCDILNISGPTILQVKNTKLPQKQSQVSDALSSKSRAQLSGNPSQSYKQLQRQPDKIFISPETVLPRGTDGCATPLPGGASAEYGNYIRRILTRAGIINSVNPFAKWHTPSHPIDPLIFHYLELFHPTTTITAGGGGGGRITVLSHRCNRKLIFQLVDELLAEIFTPHFNLRPWTSSNNGDGNFPLVDELCKKIDRFPAANCLVLEDIDSLIDKELIKSQLNWYFSEEENIVCEIEGEIVEWLLRETLAVMGRDAAEEKTGTDGCRVELPRGEMPLDI